MNSCEECQAPLQGRNKDRLLQCASLLSSAFGRAFFWHKKTDLAIGWWQWNGGRVAIPQDTDPTRSLEGDLAAHFFDGLLKGFGFVLGHAFLDGLGCSLDHGLGITKTQAGGLTHSLEDLDLG